MPTRRTRRGPQAGRPGARAPHDGTAMAPGHARPDLTRPSRSRAVRALRRLAFFLLAIGALSVAAAWAWHQPFMARPRALWELSRMPPPRGRDRRHEGVDIFAPRGTPVLSATRGVVTAVREGGLGGRQVWVLGPGRQRH